MINHSPTWNAIVSLFITRMWFLCACLYVYNKNWQFLLYYIDNRIDIMENSLLLRHIIQEEYLCTPAAKQQQTLLRVANASTSKNTIHKSYWFFCSVHNFFLQFVLINTSVLLDISKEVIEIAFERRHCVNLFIPCEYFPLEALRRIRFLDCDAMLASYDSGSGWKYSPGVWDNICYVYIV